MNRETKKIVYKLAGGTGSETLQSILRCALSKHRRPADRLEPLGKDGGEVRFINLSRQHKGVTLGIFHKVTKGAAQHVIDMQKAGDEWKIFPVTARSDKRPEGEFVEGTLFFGIWKNHVVLHQTMSCRAEQFEDYLTWLFGRDGGGSDAGGVTPFEGPTPLISLDDPIPRKVRNKDRQPVTSISIASGIESAPVGTKAKTQTAAVQFTPHGDSWEGIKAIFKGIGTPIPDELKLDNALSEQDIRVRLELSCTKKKAESAAGEVLGKLGHALRHSPGDFYTVKLVDGTIIKGSEIKVESSVRVECADRLPTPESMFKAIMEYFEQLVENQTIIEQEGFGNTK